MQYKSIHCTQKYDLLDQQHQNLFQEIFKLSESREDQKALNQFKAIIVDHFQQEEVGICFCMYILRAKSLCKCQFVIIKFKVYKYVHYKYNSYINMTHNLH